MAVAVALTGCAVPAEGPRLVPIAAAPASVDPVTATFTCQGVPEASVQAIIGYVLVSVARARAEQTKKSESGFHEREYTLGVYMCGILHWEDRVDARLPPSKIGRASCRERV